LKCWSLEQEVINPISSFSKVDSSLLVHRTNKFAAVGAVFGWRLAQHPHVRITAICRSNYEAVRKNGFVMQSRLWGNGHFAPLRVVRRVEDVKEVNFDYVICANKVIEEPGSLLIDTLRPAIRKETTLVSAQNGLSIEPPLRQAFTENTILSAVCYISCHQEKPGFIQQVMSLKDKSAFVLGIYPGGDQNMENQRLENLVSLDPHFGYVSDVLAERWTKLIFNGAWNTVTALYNLNTCEVFSNDSAIRLVRFLADEIHAVALASGAKLPKDVASTAVECARNSPAIVPSTLQDARKGRPIEIEALCGKSFP
jgi:2-dehydropantoate 2-reductase